MVDGTQGRLLDYQENTENEKTHSQRFHPKLLSTSPIVHQSHCIGICCEA